MAVIIQQRAIGTSDRINAPDSAHVEETTRHSVAPLDDKVKGESMSIELGDTVRDRITSFEGVVTGRCAYLSGCNQMLVVPPAKEGAYRDGQWFDEQRLVAVPNVDRIVLENGATPGFDTPAPKR
jgi:hypothetical protein